MPLSPEADDAPHGANLTAGLLLGAAALLIVLGLLYGEAWLSWILPESVLDEVGPRKLARVRPAYWTAAGVLLLLASCAAWVPPVARLLRRPRATLFTLATLGLLLPIYVFEWALEPFTHYRPITGLFARDADLGWRLRPSVREIWGDQMVETNSLGLRGPELTREKPEGTKRVLFLGDSVTFGFRAPFRSTFPSLAGERLREGGRHVDVINAGVGGYSPWQYDRYLRSEGILLSPDVVVIGFVLNDVTEKFRLMRFGGSSVGVQVSLSLSSFQDRLVRHSNIVFHLRRLPALWRSPSEAAGLEALDVQMLVESPDDPNVGRAWEITLANLDRIVDFANAEGVPVLLVAFPFTFQFEDPAALPVPQQILRDYAAARSLPFLDLLPLMQDEARRSGRSAQAFFIDKDHLSARGHRLVAEAVVADIRAHCWLADGTCAAAESLAESRVGDPVQ